jgi:hypothetical protein
MTKSTGVDARGPQAIDDDRLDVRTVNSSPPPCDNVIEGTSSEDKFTKNYLYLRIHLAGIVKRTIYTGVN